MPAPQGYDPGVANAAQYLFVTRRHRNDDLSRAPRLTLKKKTILKTLIRRTPTSLQLQGLVSHVPADIKISYCVPQLEHGIRKAIIILEEKIRARGTTRLRNADECQPLWISVPLG